MFNLLLIPAIVPFLFILVVSVRVFLISFLSLHNIFNLSLNFLNILNTAMIHISVSFFFLVLMLSVSFVMNRYLFFSTLFCSSLHDNVLWNAREY